MKLTIYQLEYDYSPVVIVADNSRVIFEGDNMHDQGYENFVSGYAHGYAFATNKPVSISNVYINTLEDLDKHENTLKEIGFFDEFAKSVD